MKFSAIASVLLAGVACTAFAMPTNTAPGNDSGATISKDIPTKLDSLHKRDTIITEIHFNDALQSLEDDVSAMYDIAEAYVHDYKKRLQSYSTQKTKEYKKNKKDRKNKKIKDAIQAIFKDIDASMTDPSYGFIPMLDIFNKIWESKDCPSSYDNVIGKALSMRSQKEKKEKKGDKSYDNYVYMLRKIRENLNGPTQAILKSGMAVLELTSQRPEGESLPIFPELIAFVKDREKVSKDSPQDARFKGFQAKISVMYGLEKQMLSDLGAS